MSSFSSRLNYASILLVLILSVFAETSNAQQRVRTARRRLFSLRLDSCEFVMQSFSTRPTREHKHATTVNKQFRQIFSRPMSPGKRTGARTETRIEWIERWCLLVIEWLASSLSILIILSFSLLLREREEDHGRAKAAIGWAAEIGRRERHVWTYDIINSLQAN